MHELVPVKLLTDVLDFIGLFWFDFLVHPLRLGVDLRAPLFITCVDD